MTTFDEREHAFENKFAHDEELRFRAEARRNKLLGLWAAGSLLGGLVFGSRHWRMSLPRQVIALTGLLALALAVQAQRGHPGRAESRRGWCLCMARSLAVDS